MNTASDEKKGIPEKPMPHDFNMYLPWACKQLRLDITVVITKKHSYEKEDASKFKKNQPLKSKQEIVEAGAEISTSQSLGGLKQSAMASSTNIMHMCTLYNNAGHLVELNFKKNNRLPKALLKVMGLIIHFQKHLTRITISSILDNECLYELQKFLALATITEVCLDDTAIPSGRYDLLFEYGKLKNISLARCDIDDAALKKIAHYLTYPQLASKNLLLLNLASNIITNTGAIDLALALRTNRNLVYLNLAGNKIADEGADKIFDVLRVFLVTTDEMVSFRQRSVKYYTESNSLINEILHDLKTADYEKKSKKKSPKPGGAMATSVANKKAFDKDFYRTNDKSNTGFDAFWFNKAKAMAIEKMGEYKDPFAAENVFTADDYIYCYGNNTLAYLNISYNNITYISVKKILAVLLDQKKITRGGLINLVLEGNMIPLCPELECIDSILLSNLPTTNKKHSVSRLKKM